MGSAHLEERTFQNTQDRKRS